MGGKVGSTILVVYRVSHKSLVSWETKTLGTSYLYERDDLSWEQPLTRDSCLDACAAESDMAARTLDQRGGARAGEVLLPVVDNQAVHGVQYNHYLMPNYQYYYPVY